MNDEFVEMTEYIAKSFHDLFVGDSESLSDTNSSRGAITPRENVLWLVPPRDASKASTREWLPHQMTSMTRSRKMQGPFLACGWNS